MDNHGSAVLRIAVAHKLLIVRALDIPVEQVDIPTDREIAFVRAGMVEFYKSHVAVPSPQWQDCAPLDKFIDQLIEADRA